MKKTYSLFPLFLLITIIACNNADKTKEGTDSQQALADSLQGQVVEGHDIGMSKTRMITKAKEQAQQLIDSIGKLPAKAREAAQPYKEKLSSLINDLDNAALAMDKWMESINLDSAKDNIEQRIKYLTDEKIKVGKVKETIMQSLQQADSVLRSKF
jgi:hypothetical protein